MKSPYKARRGSFAVCCALFASMTLPAQAQSGWYVAPEISYFHPDRVVFEGSDVSLGISVGREMGKGLRLELGYHALRLVPESGPGLFEQNSAHLAGQADVRLSQRWWTYSAFGLGASHTEYFGETSTLPYAFMGAGLSWDILGSGDWRLDQEFRARYTRDEDERLGDADLIGGQLLVRLRYRFGGAAIAPVPARTPATDRPERREPAPPSDRDGDGVPDSRDHCPNTIPNVAVDADGCMVRS